MTERVSPEIAQLLKKRSINLPSSRGLGAAVYEDGKIKSTCLYDGTVIHAPTIAEVLTWVLKNHSVWIELSPTIDETSKKRVWLFIPVKLETDNEIYIMSEKDCFYNSPTEAYEAAIEYCLTKLI